MMYLLLLAGFVLLIKGADFFVDGSSSIAGFLKVPSVLIGLTIVAMGTSAPEAAVSITAGLEGNSDISLGNVIGSNIFNLLIVIGISAVIFPVSSHKDIMKRDIWWNLGCTGLLFLLILDGTISRIDGFLLLSGIAAYLITIVRSARKNRTKEAEKEHLPLKQSIPSVVFGLCAIVFGGNLVVDNAEIIAETFGMSPALVGLTLVAIGTSLPELATSIVAAKKGEAGIALGNAVGSCIFNILFILGIASVLAPIQVKPELITDTLILIAVSILICIFAKTNGKTGRAEGMVCILCYLVYSVYLILR